MCYLFIKTKAKNIEWYKTYFVTRQNVEDRSLLNYYTYTLRYFFGALCNIPGREFLKIKDRYSAVLSGSRLSLLLNSLISIPSNLSPVIAIPQLFEQFLL